MSDDWKAGDVAVCVDNDVCDDCEAPSGQISITRGSVRRVRRVLRDPRYRADGLVFLTDPPSERVGWCANHFRKLRPSTESVADMIRRPQPAKETANV